MKLIYLGLLLAPVALAGHWSACKNGSGRVDSATKDCCKRQPKYSSNGIDYDTDYHDCRSHGLFTNNSVDSGAFASCCTSKNLNSEGE